MKQALIIINKKAGTPGRKQAAEGIKRWMNPALFSYELAFTRYAGEAIELSRKAAESGLDLVIAVGGDGSVNEVARGLVQSKTALGILPMGSGNGLARSLQIPLSLPKAVDVINRFQSRTIDVGFANDRLFVSNAGVGFDALVAKNFAHSRRRGFLSYVFTVIRSLAVHQPGHYRLHIDGTATERKAFFIGVANGNQLGYNFKIAPDATVDDGLLDLCIVGPLPLWRLPLAAIRSYNGSLPQSPYVTYQRCRELQIETDTALEWMQSDGDPIAVSGNHLQVRILPGALKVVVP